MSLNKLKTYYRLLTPGVHLPVYVMMYITHRCDARCKHCFFWKELNKQKSQELSSNEIDMFAKSLGPVFQVTLTGGSPELREDLPTLARSFFKHCNPYNITICMNGFHTSKIIGDVEEILNTCPNLNLTIGLSLDGIGKEHDELRGMKGLFDNVIRTFEGLSSLKSRHKNLRLASAIVVSGLNYKTAEKTALWVRKNLPIDSLKPILVRGDPREKEAVSESARKVYFKIRDNDYINLHSEFKRGDSFYRLAVITKEIKQRELIGQILETGKSPVICSASLENIVVHANGDVLGCELLSQKLGNLRDFNMDVKYLWYSGSAKEFRTKKIKEQCCCYHHCFLAPAIFRTPSQWLGLARIAWRVWRKKSF